MLPWMLEYNLWALAVFRDNSPDGVETDFTDGRRWLYNLTERPTPGWRNVDVGSDPSPFQSFGTPRRASK